MKVFAVLFGVLVAGSSAMPGLQPPKLQLENAIRSGQPRLITDQIVSAIEDVSQAIIDAGLDPLIIEHEAIDYALPVPSIFNVRAYIKDLLFRGLSNIVINNMNLNLITMRLQYRITLPQIDFNTVSSEVDCNVFGKNIHSRFSGRLTVENVVTTGNIRFNVGVISGVTIRDIWLTMEIGDIKSQLNWIFQGQDFSDPTNQWLGETIPRVLKEFESDINQMMTIVGEQIISGLL